MFVKSTLSLFRCFRCKGKVTLSLQLFPMQGRGDPLTLLLFPMQGRGDPLSPAVSDARERRPSRSSAVSDARERRPSLSSCFGCKGEATLSLQLFPVQGRGDPLSPAVSDALFSCFRCKREASLSLFNARHCLCPSVVDVDRLLFLL